MEHLSQLWSQLENYETWISIHFNSRVCTTLQNMEYAIKIRHLLLKRILKLQLREFNRD